MFTPITKGDPVYEPHAKIMELILDKHENLKCGFVLGNCEHHRLVNLYNLDFKATGIRVIDEQFKFSWYNEDSITSPLFLETISQYNHYLQYKNRNIKMKKQDNGDLKAQEFQEATKVLQGTDENTDPLYVFNDGNISVSKWKLPLKHIIRMLFHPKQRYIWLGVKAGSSQPPVWLSSKYPFK